MRTRDLVVVGAAAGAVLRALDEKVRLAHRMADVARERGSGTLAKRYQAWAGEEP